MFLKQAFAVATLLAGSAAANAQLANHVQLKIEPANRTLTVSAEERVTADPDFAVLNIGFSTTPMDAKSAYAAGAKTSNDIVSALKQAGIPETSIRSEKQQLNRVYDKPHRFTLRQRWTVKTPPERVAEILDIAVGAGATESGEIEWIVKDELALEDQALRKAAGRAKADASVLALGMGVKLGALIYTSNQVATQEQAVNQLVLANNSFSSEEKQRSPTPLSIEPRKVSSTASVYAVYAIE